MSNESFMYNLISAVARDQNSLTWQQITDGNSTINATNLEYDYYNVYNAPGSDGVGGGILSGDAANVAYWAGLAANNSSNSYYGLMLQAAQTQYQQDSTEAQADESECDGQVQASQNQTGTDSTDLQNKAQLATSINMIGSTLSNILQQVY
jgi:hypothetical protein